MLFEAERAGDKDCSAKKQEQIDNRSRWFVQGRKHAESAGGICRDAERHAALCASCIMPTRNAPDGQEAQALTAQIGLMGSGCCVDGKPGRGFWRALLFGVYERLSGAPALREGSSKIRGSIYEARRRGAENSIWNAEMPERISGICSKEWNEYNEKYVRR